MNFSQRQADPRRHLVGLSVVILFHALLVYALVTGLAKKVVDVVRAPIETKVIEEIKKPPPPPEIVLPPPPKLEAPPPPYIPPPEVQIATPPPPQPTISVAPSPVPPPPTPMTPTPPVVVAAPPAPPAPRPAVVAIGVACAQQVQPTMPSKALREGITGTVRARATIKGGKVIAVEIVSSSPRGVFDAAVRNAMMQYGCSGVGDDEIKADQTFDFKLE
ncbi:MAG: energy transducer TonB [Pseudomonadota bacterium]|jgi:protein TonB